MQRKGQYPAPAGVTDVIGLECAGQIVESGAGTSDEKLGAKVIVLLPGGGYAQYAKVNSRHVIKVPDEVTLEHVAGVPEVWCTAYQILHFVAKVKAGETLLVHAAASGVGLAMI
jgi:NADPH:quinone reductase-like Zn-dependent oxidoreductase